MTPRTAEEIQAIINAGGCTNCGAPEKAQAVHLGRYLCKSCGARSVGVAAGCKVVIDQHAYYSQEKQG